MGPLEKINTVWQKIGLVQRALLAAITVACILTGVLLTRWAAQPDMRLLFGNLDLEQASKMTDKISEQNIPYELRNGGSTLFVPAEKIHELRAMLAREGLLPKSGEPGYEIFDNEKLGVSPLVQKMNQTRALQGELSRTIQLFDGVEFARVHIVRPEQTLFTQDDQRASASVMLRLKPGWKLSSSTIAAITNLVSGAVEGLGPEQVTIADSQGRMLSNSGGGDKLTAGANTYKDYQTAVEEDMTARLMNSLEQVLGPGRATVLAKAAIDMSSETVVSTTYEKGIPVEDTVDKSETTQQTVTTTEEGTAEALPGTKEKTESITNKYMLPETVTTKTKTPGQVTNWSVSVLVDLRKELPVSASEDTGDGEQTEETAPVPSGPEELIMTVEDVKEIIRTAIGTTLLKDENLTVKHVPFYRAPVMAEQAGMGLERFDGYIEIARQLSMGLLAFCALLALRIITKAGKKAAADETALAAGPLTGSMQMLGTGAETSSSAMRQLIAGQIRQNPEQVRMLFTSWLSEDH